MNEDGTLASRTADHVIGEPSLYGRRNSPGITTRSEGSLIGATAYDSVNHRIFSADGAVIAWGANPRILVFDAHPDRITNGPEALAVLGQPDFTTRELGAIGPNRLGSRGSTVLDERHQRLFVADGLNRRIMVWDVHPDRLTETPDAMAVIGQDDFFSQEQQSGQARIGNPSSLHYDISTDRLFVSDAVNNRILIFDVSPESLRTGMNASLVIGQPDFDERDPGIGPDRLSRPGSLRYDHVNQRLFVTDVGNKRVLIFDVDEGRLQSGASATHVLGQNDFFSRQDRSDLKKLIPGATILDVKEQRLLVSEGSVLNRMLVFDVHPERIESNPDAFAVLFQEDFGPPKRATSDIFENSPRPFLDEETNTLYVASGYPGGNRVLLYDFSPENVHTGMRAFDVLGHYDQEGNPDFDARAAYGRINARYVYPRAVALDPLDHRLFVNDQYNNRVVMYELDVENRIVDRAAKVILGQPDEYSGQLRDIAANTMQIPLALAYDVSNKQLFVGDGWHNRVLVFDAHPDRFSTFDDAIAVLGQPNFQSEEPGLGSDRMNFGVAWGRGIQSTAPTPLALEVDSKNQRLFVSDGINHRVLAFDISPGMVRNGASAVGVLGQEDFISNDPTPSESARRNDSLGNTLGARIVSGRGPANDQGFDTPSGLVYDAEHDRLFVVDGNNSRVMAFNADPEQWEDGAPAFAILGQMNDTLTDELRLDVVEVGDDVGRRRFRMASGITYDSENKRLLVNDKGNDRILFFDARPEVLETGMPAIGVIGQDDFVSRNPGNGEQEQLLDPREITFDSQHQRIYATDSFWGRLMVFDLPRAERLVKVPARTMLSYGTLDAWNGREDRPGRDAREAWRGSLQGSPALGGILVYSSTRQELDVLAKRRGRVLLSETSVAASTSQEKTLLYVDGRNKRANTLLVSNPDSRENPIGLRLSLGGETHFSQTAVPGNGRLEVNIDELFGISLEGVEAGLEVDAQWPVATIILGHRPTIRGDSLVLASTGSSGWDGKKDPLVLPGLKIGGGYRSEFVLLNPSASVIEGQITLFDRDGTAVTQLQPGVMGYRIESGEAFSWDLGSSLGVEDTVYAVIVPTTGAAPSATARLSSWKGMLLLNETEIPAKVATANAWVPVDTMASIIRHGETHMNFSFANASRTPATVRLTLFDQMGNESGRWEQILPAYAQRDWSLADLFNVRSYRGALRLWSDAPLALSARRITRNMRGDLIENEISYVNLISSGSGLLEFPDISEGQGLATEILLVNPSGETAEGQFRFAGAAGNAKEIILR